MVAAQEPRGNQTFPLSVDSALRGARTVRLSSLTPKMPEGPQRGPKRAHEGPTYAPATLDETLRSTLSMGMGPQGGGGMFLLRLRRWMHLVTPNRNAYHWSARTLFQYIELKSFWNWYF